MTANDKTLVIVPAYNEAETIDSVVRALLDLGENIDVLVVDDGSQDRTAEIVRAIPDATLLQLPFNLGIGGCMQTGYTYAYRNGYAVAVQCDADGQHPPAFIPELVQRLHESNSDMVIGSRYVADSAYVPSFGRRLGKSLLSRWINFWIGGGITDTTSGFRAMNRRAMAVVVRGYPEDYPEPEILVVLHRHGLKSEEIPVEMHPRQGGETSIGAGRSVYYMIKVSLAILVDMFRDYGSRRGEKDDA
jgi:glycosyltransferase involved in cell wall biosynthesis